MWLDINLWSWHLSWKVEHEWQQDVVSLLRWSTRDISACWRCLGRHPFHTTTVVWVFVCFALMRQVPLLGMRAANLFAVIQTCFITILTEDFGWVDFGWVWELGLRVGIGAHHTLSIIKGRIFVRIGVRSNRCCHDGGITDAVTTEGRNLDKQNKKCYVKYGTSTRRSELLDSSKKNWTALSQF